MNFKIEGIISHAIFTERNNTDYHVYQTNIMNNICNIDLNNKINNYEPCGRSLYVTIPRMRVYGIK